MSDKIRGKRNKNNETKNKETSGKIDEHTKKYIKKYFEAAFIERKLLAKQKGGEYNEDCESLVKKLQNQYDKYISEYNKL